MGVCGQYSRLSNLFPRAAICAGVVPQQPPNIFTPSLTSSAEYSAKSSGDILYSFVAGSGSPAFGFAITGRDVREHIFSNTG